MDIPFMKIEKALGFKLYDWQKNYILEKSNEVVNKRASGKTTAHILRILFMGEDPIEIYIGRDKDARWIYGDDHVYVDKGSYEYFYKFYLNTLKRISDALIKNGIKCREVFIYR